MLTKSERIRRVLENNFDLPAADVVERLERKGVEVEVGLVHVVRSSMRKDQQAEKQRADAVKQQEKLKLQRTAAKVQETRLLNPRPLRDHIMDALCNHRDYTAKNGLGYSGLPMEEIIKRCRTTYKGGGPAEVFNQSVRKKLRNLVLSEDVAQVGNKYTPKKEYVRTSEGWQEKTVHMAACPGLYPPLAPVGPSGLAAEFEKKLDEGVRRNEVVAGTENGIAFLVGKLKEIVAKVGKKETKELIDVL